ncbi:unnamed protein product [Caenorhabditis brenneri]
MKVTKGEPLPGYHPGRGLVSGHCTRKPKGGNGWIYGTEESLSPPSQGRTNSPSWSVEVVASEPRSPGAPEPKTCRTLGARGARGGRGGGGKRKDRMTKNGGRKLFACVGSPVMVLFKMGSQSFGEEERGTFGPCPKKVCPDIQLEV